jgi:hypothetical protein
MADEQQQAQPAADNPNNLDPAFFTSVNEYLELTNRQSREHGLKRISLASLFAAARFNSHVFLSSIEPGQAAGDRKDFLEYMTTMYRRMLNEHLDGLGHERNIDVGESELAEEYAAAGVQVGRMAAANSTASANDAATPASEYVSAAGAVPPATSDKE